LQNKAFSLEPKYNKVDLKYKLTDNTHMLQMDIPEWPEYELLDSGNERKLERFGKFILNRIETQALWKQSLSEDSWHNADAVYKKTDEKRGEWIFKKNIPKSWVLSFEKMRIELQLTASGHVGIFPEQSTQWRWIYDTISKSINTEQNARSLNVLSLFTYTGASTLAAAAAGANVTHIDASKPAISWARRNQELSKIEDKPIRWIPEDALKFVKREVRRGSRYDAIIMDPPKFGRGTQGEVWKFEENFPELLDYCRQILSDKALFILITAYAVPISSITLSNLLSDATRKLKGNIVSGELGLKQSSNDRILQTAIYAKWES
jgi:23S rRNA (cytosine1962-C5)-methyltransferase